jgi:hypothetical protein
MADVIAPRSIPTMNLEERIGALIDGELPPAERESVEAEISARPEAREFARIVSLLDRLAAPRPVETGAHGSTVSKDAWRCALDAVLARGRRGRELGIAPSDPADPAALDALEGVDASARSAPSRRGASRSDASRRGASRSDAARPGSFRRTANSFRRSALLAVAAAFAIGTPLLFWLVFDGFGEDRSNPVVETVLPPDSERVAELERGPEEKAEEESVDARDDSVRDSMKESTPKSADSGAATPEGPTPGTASPDARTPDRERRPSGDF